jgi:hypothetical protein
LPFELVGFICVFFGLLVSMVFLRIACSWIWIGRFMFAFMYNLTKSIGNMVLSSVHS